MVTDADGSVVESPSITSSQAPTKTASAWEIAVNWATVSTNRPSNGFFDYVESPALASPARFFRSVILP